MRHVGSSSRNGGNRLQTTDERARSRDGGGDRMTPEEISLLFAPDLNLSPEARALVAYVSTVTGAEVPFDRLMRLLQIKDARKLRRAIGDAEESGWLIVERQTGKGHHPRFHFRP